MDRIARNAALIERMHANDTVMEIFRDVARNYDNDPTKRRIDFTRFWRNKMKREESSLVYRILNTAIKLRSLQGICLLKAILARANYAKDLFLMNVEEAEPVKIPEDLS